MPFDRRCGAAQNVRDVDGHSSNVEHFIEGFSACRNRRAERDATNGRCLRRSGWRRSASSEAGVSLRSCSTTLDRAACRAVTTIFRSSLAILSPHAGYLLAPDGNGMAGFVRQSGMIRIPYSENPIRHGGWGEN